MLFAAIDPLFTSLAVNCTPSPGWGWSSESLISSNNKSGSALTVTDRDFSLLKEEP